VAARLIAPRARLVLLRHAKTVARHGLAIGQFDVPLSASGKVDAARAARLWTGAVPERIVASDLSRTVETARALAKVFTRPVSLDPAWREIAYGEWEGRRFSDLEREDRERLHRWYHDWRTHPPPGGESWLMLKQRIRSALAALAKVDQAGTILVVTHAGPIRAALACVHGDADDQALALAPSHLAGYEIIHTPPSMRCITTASSPG